jgi:hypothetical protein
MASRPLYTDGDLTLAAYAAALQVVTSYSSVDRPPLDRDLYRKLGKNERTMIRDLVEYAAHIANGMLVPEGFPRDAWRDLGSPEGIQSRNQGGREHETQPDPDQNLTCRPFATAQGLGGHAGAASGRRNHRPRGNRRHKVTPAIAETVKKQIEAGIDCIGDGEFWTARNLAHYARGRLFTGYGGPSAAAGEVGALPHNSAHDDRSSGDRRT